MADCNVKPVQQKEINVENNFEKNLREYSTNTILERARKIEDKSNNRVFTHYKYLIEFAKASICKKNLNELIGLIHMCYGWMPTMYKKSDISLYKDNELIKEIWEKINEGSLDSVILDKLKSITNNSIIGTSKLLHFCKPEMYAIYDSKIYCCISGNTTTSNYNNVDYYISYMKKMKEWKENKIFMEELREILSNNNPCIVKFSDLRCIEMCFFYNN